MNYNYLCKVCFNTVSSSVVSGIKDWEFGVNGTFEYRLCNHCGQVQLHPFPDIEELILAYPDSYTAYVSTASSRGRVYNFLYFVKNYLIKHRLKEIIMLGARVLDIGCGNGDFLVKLKSIGAQYLEGIDFNIKAVSLAAAKGIKAYHGIFLDFPAQAHIYDMVIMNNYLEHVVDPIAELQKVKDILKPKGVLIGEVPNFSSLDRRIFRRFWGGNHVPRHTFQYATSNLYQLFDKAGFKNIKITFPLDTGEIAMSIQNWLMRNMYNENHTAKLKNGRIKGFNLLLVLLLPIAIILWILRRSSLLRFRVSA